MGILIYIYIKVLADYSSAHIDLNIDTDNSSAIFRRLD